MSSNSSDSPALGARGNWYGRDDPSAEAPRGHVECGGTDAAEYKAFQLLLRFVDPVCAETGEPLTGPTFHLPKQTEVAPGKFDEFCQEQHRRRYGEANGRINWGESTSTDVPEVGYDVYRLCVHTYLAEREFRLSELDDYLEYADRVWSDPQYGSTGALEQFIEHVRDCEAPER